MDQVHFFMLIYVAIGLIVGGIIASILIFKNVNAILGVNINDPEKDQYNLVVLCPLEDLRKKKYLIVQVKQS